VPEGLLSPIFGMYRPRPILWQINLPKECPIDIDGG
jgi:hypothetical protein